MELNNYYYSTNLEDGYLKIDSNLLYSLWDKKKSVILVAENACKQVITKDYEGFKCEENYRKACFKPDGIDHGLDAFYLKLLRTIHHEWFNILLEYWKSPEFISILQQIGKLRTTQIVVPSKEEQFNFLKERIHVTVISDSVTDVGVEIWKPFIEKLQSVQQDNLLNRKKYDL